jgi:hypothetical protein
MLEIPEEETFEHYIALFISYSQTELPPGSLIIQHIWADFKKMDLVNIAEHEGRLL